MNNEITPNPKPVNPQELSTTQLHQEYVSPDTAVNDSQNSDSDNRRVSRLTKWLAGGTALAAVVAGGVAMANNNKSSSEVFDNPQPGAEQNYYSAEDLQAIEKLNNITVAETESKVGITTEEAIEFNKDPFNTPSTDVMNAIDPATPAWDYHATINTALLTGDSQIVTETLSSLGLGPKEILDLYNKSIQLSLATAPAEGDNSPANGWPNTVGAGPYFEDAVMYTKSLSIALARAHEVAPNIPPSTPYKYPETIKEELYITNGDNGYIATENGEILNESNSAVYTVGPNGELIMNSAPQTSEINEGNAIFWQAPAGLTNIYPYPYPGSTVAVIMQF